ncbi:lactonase family protein [Aquiflexum sp.]|uniref:lactonase family protein n=1 Tax=Aquiflexum sp. TaxID=1872584 RepID=UPI00359470FF
MKKIKLSLMLLAAIIMTNSCDETPQEQKADIKYEFLVGSYTDSDEEGIALLTFNPEENLISMEVIAAGVKNPSFLVSNRAQTYVYAVEETGGENGGKVKSFKFDRENNTLELLDTKDTFGNHPCYLTLDPNEEFLAVGNYSGGNFAVYKLNNGMLEHVQTQQHEGQSVVSGRQDKSHVHSVVFHPNGEQMLVGDLGADKIFIYDFNPTYAVPFNPAPEPYLEVSPGAGPRHLAIHPDGKTVYMIHEMSAELGVYSYDDGQMAKKQIAPLTGEGFTGNVGAAEVRISPDAKFVYASNRGDANDISVFSIGRDGNVTFVERVDTGGETPRNFAITKDGEYLIAANQGSNNIIVFERDQKTGKLIKTELTVSINKPVYFFGLD